jgi:hypothetical protein
MTALSIVLPYYRNPRMLYRQYLIWCAEWSAEAKAQLEVIVVDDGSPEPAAEVPRPAGLPPLSIYRVLEDRPWHQHGARNLGAHVAAGQWLLMTDMDHVIPGDTLREVLRNCDHYVDRVYTFGRVDAPIDEPWKADHWSTMKRTTRPDGSLKPHVNSFAMTRNHYWRVGGYDEDYCGLYGTDRLFRTRLFQEGPPVHLAGYPLIRVSRDVIPDASTRDIARKEGRPEGAKKIVRAAKEARGDGDKIKTLAFPWERVL